jgi:hypothetical protein
MSSSVNVSEVKITKDPKTNTYIIQENKQLKSNKLPVVQWRITNKQKKILGFTIAMRLLPSIKSNIEVYFTKV